MGDHEHPHRDRRGGSEERWALPSPGGLAGVAARLRRWLHPDRPGAPHGLRELPVALRRGPMAAPYLAAERQGDHRAAAEAARSAMERAATAEDWWAADVWGHRSLWHWERAEETLEAVRMARRIGDVRVAAGDAAGARRYYAEAIDEARDVGAEHEQGLASIGLGRALLELGAVTQARRLASAAVDLLERAGAPAGDLEAARGLLGTEVPVGELDDGAEDRS